VPFGQCRFPILFGVGIDKVGSIFNWIKDRKMAEIKGSWYNTVLSSGELIKFQSTNWPAVYNKHQAEIDAWLWEQAGYGVGED
jgi:hypothetical protein